MRPSLLQCFMALFIAPAALCTRTVYYSSGSASHVTFKGHFEVAKSVYSDEGKLVSSKNLTSLDAFMIGYVRVNPEHTQIVFAAQTQNSTGFVNPNVQLFSVPIGGGKPSLLIDTKRPELLAPCQAPSPVIHGGGPCTQLDVFHPFHDDTGDGSGAMAFGYRAWDRAGFPSGNQALAVLTADGSVKPLTFNASDIRTSDECPRFIKGSNGTQLMFIRSLMEGSDRRVAHLDIKTGVITLLDGPVPDGWGGCLAPMESDFLYVTDSDKPRMEAAVVTALTPFKYTMVDWFAVPRVDTSSVKDALSLQYCTHISGGAGLAIKGSIACKNIQYGISIVDTNNGSISTNLTIPLPWFDNWDMTPNSFHVWDQ